MKLPERERERERGCRLDITPFNIVLGHIWPCWCIKRIFSTVFGSNAISLLSFLVVFYYSCHGIQMLLAVHSSCSVVVLSESVFSFLYSKIHMESKLTRVSYVINSKLLCDLT